MLCDLGYGSVIFSARSGGFSLHTFGLLCDLGYGSTVFSAHIDGFESVPTCGDLVPSSSSDPRRSGWRGWWYTLSSVVGHCGNSG